jgi:hypothetical protein
MRPDPLLGAALITFSLGMSPANAAECHLASSPRYALASDTVEWSLEIDSGQSCIRGLRFNNVAVESVKLESRPQIGQVSLFGSGFTYSAKPDYVGRDSFTLAVTGTISKARGSSSIRVVVSVGTRPSASIAPRDRNPTTVRPPSTSPIDNNLPLPASGSLPPCPTWDWSQGAPPPMRPPFDRSKLYCPPAPFKPPSQPIGCTCSP